MNSNYPIVAENSLPPVPPKKLFGPKPKRDGGHIPSCGSAQRLVYRIGNDYALDHGALTMDSDIVLEATHVTLIDVSRDVQVPVQLGISSRDASDFQIRVVFTCTVNDPVEVVRNGTRDMADILTAYVRKHPRLSELGLDFELSDFNAARRKIIPQIRAYVMTVPPIFHGIRTELASVDVLTPAPVRTLHDRLRDGSDRHQIDFMQQTRDQAMRAAATVFEQDSALRAQRHELNLDATERDYQRYQFQQHRGIAEDPMAALEYAFSIGEISAQRLAEERLKRDDADRAFVREESVRARDWERAVSERREERETAAAQRKWESERLDLMDQWRLKEKRLELALEESRQRDEMRKELLRKALDGDLIDSLNLEQIMRVMFSENSEATRSSELSEVEGMGSLGSGRSNVVDDAVVREEDGN
ncbi:hypothetical protein IU427_33075 [Nocardia beijingensis]|uniref:hypothetical protein n=1 Tax=Nocardia beijingensis TaxID=95162 RepID=UPI0018954E02|nr:hypothetical protein [Nocardia beijingensis]MBF6469954.1 hypothetical protein [Nocardia beijingensis]